MSSLSRIFSTTRQRFAKPAFGVLMSLLFLFGSLGPNLLNAQVAHARTDTGGGGAAGNNRITDDCRSYTDATQYLQCLSIFGSGADKLIADFNDQVKKANTVEKIRSLLGVDPSKSDDSLAYRNVINGKEWIIPTKGLPEADEDALNAFLDQDDGRVRNTLEKAKSYRTDVFLKDSIGENPDDYIYPDKGTFIKLQLKGGLYLDEDTTKILENLDVGDGLAGAAAGCAGGAAVGGIGCGPGAVGGFLVGNANWTASLVGLGGTKDIALWIFQSPNNKNVYGTVQCRSNGGTVTTGEGIGPLPGGTAFAFLDERPSSSEDAGNISEEGAQDNIIPEDKRIARRDQTLAGDTKQLQSGRPIYNSAMAGFLCGKANNKEDFQEFCSSKFSAENCVFDERSWSEALIGSPIQKALGWMRDAANYLMQLAASAVETIITATNLGSFPGLLSGWKVMRDLANIAFVLMLSAVAFASILRIDTERYGVRRLLPRLIFAVIAVNFSLLFVIMITNVAQILSQPFIGGVQTLLNSNPADNVDSFVNIGDVGAAIVGVLMVLLVAVVLGLLALLFIVRMMILLILGALGPMAVLFAVLPLSSGLAKSWFDNLIKWAMMAPASLIIVYIGANFTRSSSSFGNDLLQTGVFLIAVIGAIFIPLEMGGRLMSAVNSGAKKGGGFAARRTGVAAAYQQQKLKSERAQELKGAKLRKGLSTGARVASLGLIGRGTATDAKQQIESHEQEEAQKYASTFNAEELGKMQGKFAKGSEMHKTLGMARDIRTGVYQARQQADQESRAIEAFQALPEELQSQRIARITDRNVKQESPQFLEHLANTGQISELATGGIEGILEQNQAGQINALRVAHRNGHITDDQLAGLSRNDRALYDHRIAREQNTPLPTADRGERQAPPERPVLNERPEPNSSGRARPEPRQSRGGIDLPPGVEDNR